MKKSFKYLGVLMLCVLCAVNAQAQSEELSSRVFQFGECDYIVTKDGSVGFSEAFLYASTDLLGLRNEFTKPGYFVANFMVSNDLSEITVTVKAEDLFEAPLLLNINNSKLAEKQNVNPYSQRKEFATKHPNGVIREFTIQDDVNSIILENSRQDGSKMIFRLAMRGKLADLVHQSGTNTLLMPDTTRRSNTIYDTYATEHELEQDVFAIILNSDGSGVFYGNTDLFDEVREGYTPGFYAVPMRALTIKGNEMSFEIEIGVNDISGSQSFAVKSAYANAESLLNLYPGHQFKVRLSGTAESNKIVIRKAGTKLLNDLVFVR